MAVEPSQCRAGEIARDQIESREGGTPVSPIEIEKTNWRPVRTQ